MQGAPIGARLWHAVQPSGLGSVDQLLVQKPSGRRSAHGICAGCPQGRSLRRSSASIPRINFEEPGRVKRS